MDYKRRLVLENQAAINSEFHECKRYNSNKTIQNLQDCISSYQNNQNYGSDLLKELGLKGGKKKARKSKKKSRKSKKKSRKAKKKSRKSKK